MTPAGGPPLDPLANRRPRSLAPCALPKNGKAMTPWGETPLRPSSVTPAPVISLSPPLKSRTTTDD